MALLEKCHSAISWLLMGPGGTEAAEGKEAGAGTGEEAKGEGGDSDAR